MQLLPLLGVTLLLLLHQFPGSYASRILLMPFPFKSHVSEFRHIGEPLVARGHDVHMMLPANYDGLEKFRRNGSLISALEYTSKYPDFLSWESQSNDEAFNFEQSIELDIVDELRNYYQGVVEVCYNVLESDELEQKVNALKFDLVILDAFPCTRCFMVLAYRLDIPFASVTTQYEPWVMRNPALPSFVPFPFRYPPLTPNMNFWERLSNLWWLVDWSYHTGSNAYLSDEFVTKYAPNKAPITLNQLSGRSLLWLFDTDISIDFPRPLMPNEINIGGLSVEPAKPLSKDLEKFVSSAAGGTILASFGSSSAMPRKYLLKMVDAFKMLPSDVHVVLKWPFDDTPETPKPKVEKNILLMDWVPQTDLLGHKNTKLFITHCGANSQFEGLYHGVTMINIPAYGDQHYNAKRGNYHGISETLSVKTFTPTDLYDTILKVLSTPSYHDNIAHASSLFRSQPLSPRERAAWWVEHVLQYGGQHLHAHALDMPGYQYLMIDILAFLFGTLLASLMLICCVCRSVVRACRGKNKGSMKLKKQ